MRDFLLLTIYSPMSSWGDIAVGEVRGSWDRPSRSAIVGLVAGALGVTREQQDRHEELDLFLGVAVRVDQAGRARSDYHTTQTVSASDIRRERPRTRGAMLRAGIPRTVLSRRWFREDAAYTVALWEKEMSRWTLTELAERIARPTFVPFAGRKAHPLALPMHPLIVRATTLAEAFRQRSADLPGVAKDACTVSSASVEIAHDECIGFASGLTLIARQSRRDGRAHRSRWLFSDRTVCISRSDAQEII